MIKNKRKIAVITGAVVAIMAVAGTAAYFTATDQALNTWTVGKVEIELDEKTYDQNKATETKDIVPNSELHKDPKIVNTGNNKAFVFMKVKVPKANVKVASQNGAAPAAASMQELFDYQWNSGWTVVDSQEVKDANGGTYQEYLVTYGTSSECKTLNAGETTPVLLTNGSGTHIAHPDEPGLITFKNIIEGQGLEEVQLEMNVETYAIQADNLTTGDTKKPEEVWAIISNQNGI